MNRNTLYWVSILIIMTTFIIGQSVTDEDSISSEEESASESSHNLYIMFDQEQGNTNHIATGAEYSFSLIGDWGVCRIPNFQLSLGETMLLYQMNPTRLMAISILNSTFGQIWIYLHFSSMIIHLIDH